MTVDESKGYKQWVKVAVKNKTGETITLKDFKKEWGRFFEYPNNFEKEVPPPEGQEIKDNGTFYFASCGRENATSGTEWLFSIYGPDGEIARYHWDCPIIGTNRFDLVRSSDDYIVQDKGFNRTSNGALGEGTITVVKL